jgi:hypothetical protein
MTVSSSPDTTPCKPTGENALTAAENHELNPQTVVEALGQPNGGRDFVAIAPPAKTLFHFTTCCHLPRIIRSGELRPAVYPNQPRDFVHATDNEHGERTAAGWWTWAKTYRAGDIQRVRFTLDAADFEPWREVYARYPEWKPDMIERLIAAAASQGQSTEGHHCRAEPLPLSKVLAVHTRGYTTHKWTPLDLASATVIDAENDNPKPNADCLGIVLGGKVYFSVQERTPDGRNA